MSVDVGWHPVALAADIEPGTCAGTRLFGREIVVWRDQAGAAHVWEDRCPHRGMRLSFGFVRGDQLACLYHGWRFDGAGRCRLIPAHPNLDVPETIKVEPWVSAEQTGIVWVAWGGAEAAGPPPGGNAATIPVRSLCVLAPRAAVLNALEASNSPWAKDPPAVVERQGSLLWLRARSGSLAIALQSLSSEETCLHLCLDGSAAPEQRLHVSLWAQALRGRAEASQAAPGWRA